MQPGSALSQLGIDTSVAAAPDPATLPQAEQDAMGKCSTPLVRRFWIAKAAAS